MGLHVYIRQFETTFHRTVIRHSVRGKYHVFSRTISQIHASLDQNGLDTSLRVSVNIKLGSKYLNPHLVDMHDKRMQAIGFHIEISLTPQKYLPFLPGKGRRVR